MEWEQVSVCNDYETSDNIYQVPLKMWRRWTDTGRRLFNHLYGIAQLNKKLYCGTDLFSPATEHEAKVVEGVVNATTWNLAVEAASTISKM